MGSPCSLIFAFVATFFLLVQCEYHSYSDMADVVIAVDTRNLASPFPTTMNVFFNGIASDLAAMISKEKIHVSIAHFSNAVHVDVPLRNGTDPITIKNVRFDYGNTSGTMENEDISTAVREAALKPEMGKRQNVPSIVIVLLKYETSDTVFSNWMSKAVREMNTMGIGIGTKADIAMVVNKYDGQRPFFFIANSTLGMLHTSDHAKTPEDLFQNAAIIGMLELQRLLETCPYRDDISTTCYYKDAACVANATVYSEPTNAVDGVNYCVSDFTTRQCNSTDQCERQCQRMGRWTECESKGCGEVSYRYWRPIDNDPVTLFVFEACVEFRNRTVVSEVCKRNCDSAITKERKPRHAPDRETSSAPATTSAGTLPAAELLPPQSLRCTEYKSVSSFKDVMTMCHPVWLNLVWSTAMTAIGVVVTFCIKEFSFKRRLKAEQQKLMNAMRQSMEKKTGPSSSAAAKNERTKSPKQQPTTKNDPGKKQKAEPVISPKQDPTSKSDNKMIGSDGAPIRPPSLTARTVDELVKGYKTDTRKPSRPKRGPRSMEAGANKETLKPETRKAHGGMSKLESRVTGKKKAMLHSTGYRER